MVIHSTAREPVESAKSHKSRANARGRIRGINEDTHGESGGTRNDSHYDVSA